MRRKLVRQSLKFVTILSILVGCAFQSCGVMVQYFKYQTMRMISIRDYPEEEIAAPGVVVCTRFDIDPSIESKIGQLFTGDYFNDKNDSWRIEGLWGKVFGKKK